MKVVIAIDSLKNSVFIALLQLWTVKMLVALQRQYFQLRKYDSRYQESVSASL